MTDQELAQAMTELATMRDKAEQVTGKTASTRWPKTTGSYSILPRCRISRRAGLCGEVIHASQHGSAYPSGTP